MNSMNDDISYCKGCHCMTHTIKKGPTTFVCGKCGYPKKDGGN